MDFVITLDEATVNVIGNALAEQPYKTVAATIAILGRQVQEQTARSKMQTGSPQEPQP